jgi:hypothetical protein
VTSSAENLLGITQGVALDFLHSVVLIDDRVYLGPVPLDTLPATPVPVEIITPQRQGGATQSDIDPAVVSEEAIQIPVTEHPLDAKPLLDRFAEQGLVFAPLRLDKEDDEQKTIKASQRADIVVIDWKINGNYGDTTIRLIKGILTTGDTHRLRLIAVYTGERDLADITDRIRTELDAILPNETKPADETFAVTRGPVRVVVYAKAATLLPQENPELYARIAAPEELPDRLVTDFARMTSGLVSNVALEALARLRANMHHVLRRLHPGLDAAYLSHRALVSPPEEAEDHLVALVVSEIAAVLEENAVGHRAGPDAIRAWLQDRLAADVDFKQIFSLGTLDPLDGLCGLLDVGVDSKSVPTEFKPLRKKEKARALTERFCKPDADAAQRDQEFAMLLSLREQYVSRLPYLTLGTVLATADGVVISYWVCIQPVCDAVRLTVNRKFPLLPLKIVTGDQEPFDMVIDDGAVVRRLKASLRPFEQDTPIFAPDAQSKTVKPAREGSATVFTSIDGTKYRWIGELKPDYAQRLLNAFGAHQNRVGVVESEWMRRSRDPKSKPGEE